MIRGAVALLACGALLAGCGADREGPAPPSTLPARAGTPAGDAQLLSLAHVLEANRAHGGARFTARLKVNGGATLATGRVDFRSGRGTAVLRGAQTGSGPPRRIYWTRAAVFAQSAPGSRRYARQAPDAQDDPVHGMVAFVNLLAAETIDNTTALAAEQVRHLRAAPIAGTAVDRYDLGRDDDTTLWLAHDSGFLRRIHTNNIPGGLTIDLLSHAPITINLPADRDA
jgi:hypothetical protein